MSQGNGQNGQGDLSERERSTLDKLLEGRSDSFKVKVLDLVVRNGWDVDEPSFQILLATGQMEVLLSQFPEEFESLFRQLLEGQRQQFVEQKRFLEAQGVAIQDYLKGVEATGSQLVAGVKEQVWELRQFARAQREQAERSVEQVLTLAQEQEDKQRRLLEKAMAIGSQKHLIAVADQANTLIETAGEKLKGKHLQELITMVVAAAIAFTSLGGIMGWTFHRLTMGELDPAGPRQLSLSQWESLQWAVSKEGQLARNLIRWNQSNLYECRAGQGIGNEDLGIIGYEDRVVKYGVCALWVVPPEKRRFGPKRSQ